MKYTLDHHLQYLQYSNHQQYTHGASWSPVIMNAKMTAANTCKQRNKVVTFPDLIPYNTEEWFLVTFNPPHSFSLLPTNLRSSRTRDHVPLSFLYPLRNQ